MRTLLITALFFSGAAFSAEVSTDNIRFNQRTGMIRLDIKNESLRTLKNIEALLQRQETERTRDRAQAERVNECHDKCMKDFPSNPSDREISPIDKQRFKCLDTCPSYPVTMGGGC